MATNKRKDSAALFELIDKSTLKIPKNSASLKIPTWWSSKTNPSPAPSTPASTPRPVLEPLSKAPPAPVEEPVEHVEEVPEAAPEAEHPLFDTPDVPVDPAPAPVPAAVEASETPSPSFRPPAPSAGARFAPPAINGATTHANGNGHHHNGHHVEPISEDDLPADTPPLPTPLPSGTEAYAGLGEGKRVFAPQTMSQTDGYFGGGRLGGMNGPVDWKIRLARAPMWVMVAGASGILIVLLLIVYGLMSVRGSTKPTPTPTPLVTNNHQPSLGSNSHTQAGNAATPPHQLLPNQGVPANNSLREATAQRETAPATPGQVYGPGTIARNPDLYYVIIATTPTEFIARRNADHIAKNGVDVSIETQMSRSGKMLYRLISVQGAPSTSEAQPLRKRIVDIGHLLPDFAKTRKAWDDATVMKWSSLLGAAARG